MPLHPCLRAGAWPPNPIQASEIRLYTTDSPARVKELALYPPNGPTGFPLGTDVILNLAWQRETEASSIDGNDYQKRAVDGYLDDTSRWVSANNSEDDWLEVTLSATHIIGSAHVYTGYGSGSADSTFRLQYYSSRGWLDIPGTYVVNNPPTNTVIALNFPIPVSASRVRTWSSW